MITPDPTLIAVAGTSFLTGLWRHVHVPGTRFVGPHAIVPLNAVSNVLVMESDDLRAKQIRRVRSGGNRRLHRVHRQSRGVHSRQIEDRASRKRKADSSRETRWRRGPHTAKMRWVRNDSGGGAGFMSELKLRPPKEGKVGNLLVAEGFDGIQAGGAAGGVQACD